LVTTLGRQILKSNGLGSPYSQLKWKFSIKITQLKTLKIFELNSQAKMAPDTGAGFRSLADVWADTTTPHGRLMLTVLGGLAEFERELIRTRTGEGRARAKTRGIHMGRPPKLTAHQKHEALKALADGSASQADLARRFNVNQATISRLAR
jgi:DNA invertase Pin-like site-specific DNA recombinase